ncbi:MAG: hypothetical protein KAK04_23635, partial [Cyclobacteriaceae bacterium]|nr:hypothetical protein [Cyclobacteriaceae bacterium]
KFIIFREAEKDEPYITHITKDGRSFFPGNQFETKPNPYIELINEDGQFRAHVTEPGDFELTWSDGKKSLVKVENAIAEQPISGSWELSFDTAWGGPEKVSIDELKSWTEFSDEGIKYYSGTATYNKSFSISKKEIKNKKLLLDLGNVQEMAAIKINGQQMPVKWSAPFVFDITKHVKAGINNLEVEVVNMWPNRLILDGRLPEEKRLTKTNVSKFETEDAEKYLRASGLLGPVKVRFFENVALRKF